MIELKDAGDLSSVKWPFFGYAPGHYMGTCHGCGETIINVDKRARTCLPCAMAAAMALATTTKDTAHG